jgi:pilus assembly protein Flp/PilA
MSFRTLWSRGVREEDGQDLIEYGLLAALISVIAVLAIAAVGTKLQTSYQNIETSIP